MSNTTTLRIPKLTKHKATGQAVVRLNGKDHYVGKYGTAAARESYERLIAEWLAGGRNLLAPDRTGPSVNEIILAAGTEGGSPKIYRRRPIPQVHQRLDRPTQAIVQVQK